MSMKMPWTCACGFFNSHLRDDCWKCRKTRIETQRSSYEEVCASLSDIISELRSALPDPAVSAVLNSLTQAQSLVISGESWEEPLHLMGAARMVLSTRALTAPHLVSVAECLSELTDLVRALFSSSK